MPGGHHDPAQVLDPVATGRGPLDLADHDFGDAVEEVVLALDVAVDRHRVDAELLAELAHAQVVEAAPVGEGHAGLEDAFAGQGSAAFGLRGFLDRHLDSVAVGLVCLRRSLRCRQIESRGGPDHVRIHRERTAAEGPAVGPALARPHHLDRASRPLLDHRRPRRSSGYTPTQWGMLRLKTVGRQTGKERVAIVGYIEDGANLVTPAMNGWADPEPAWWLNLQANPEAVVELRGESRRVVARAAVGDERRRLWEMYLALG